MNLVLEDTEEVKNNRRDFLGMILLKGDCVTLLRKLDSINQPQNNSKSENLGGGAEEQVLGNEDLLVSILECCRPRAIARCRVLSRLFNRAGHRAKINRINMRLRLLISHMNDSVTVGELLDTADKSIVKELYQAAVDVICSGRGYDNRMTKAHLEALIV